MKPDLVSKSQTKLVSGLAALLLWAAPVALHAQSFTYTNCDLVAGFRIIGGAYDLVVDLGPVTVYENQTPRSVVTITSLSSAQLAAALPTLWP